MNIIGDVEGSRRHHRRRHDRHRRHALRGRPGGQGAGRAGGLRLRQPRRALAAGHRAHHGLAARGAAHHRHDPGPRPTSATAPRSRFSPSRACSARRSSASITATRSARCLSEHTARTTQRKQSWNSQRSTSRSGAVSARVARARCAPPARFPASSTASRSSPIAVTFNEKELLHVARQGEAAQHRSRALHRRRRRQVREGDGHGARRADRSAVAAAGPRRLPARRSGQRGPRDGAARAHRQGDRHHQRRQPAPEHARHPHRRQAGRDPDQARGRRHAARTWATRSTSATSSSARACARCSIRATPSRRSWRPRPRRSEAEAAPVEGAVPAEGAAGGAARRLARPPAAKGGRRPSGRRRRQERRRRGRSNLARSPRARTLAHVSRGGARQSGPAVPGQPPQHGVQGRGRAGRARAGHRAARQVRRRAGRDHARRRRASFFASPWSS